ncbi:MAG: hypothetical protein GWM90_26160, partial [Gemmatimonadetes bacterium]|nr:hypothetical protein [Gemmatimonadota bacterium]NIQ58373.1 hypothetical protein [Gemmatimonadota bacterium]NIU78589.1 hypothetical protein [Gammaproteobacteria bacterium]NIX47429.1 hypothetical protein [Gemmatimonadota bacterium]NIY11812.1 hypothetical protein [Gemmatimonadota bacterium]
MQQILRELSRRRVFRVAGLYVVVAWLVVQVAETTFPLLSLPDWSVTLALALALVGFPLALVLAWAYDVTPGGLRLGREGQPATEPVADGGAGEAPAGGGAGAREGGRSIAVLPFANLSANEENEYFSDGVTEEILDALTKVTTLQVAAMAVIRKHLDLVPDDPRAYYLGAHALICLDRQEEAREWIDRAAALDPEDPGV